MWTQTKLSWALWLTNDKASYVAKEDNICLLRVAKEATLNEQWIKPCVPFDKTQKTNCDKIQKLKLWQNLKNQIVTVLKNSNCDGSSSDSSESSS